MPFKYDANAAADDFIRMLWDHHPEASGARTTEELLEYVAVDLFSAMQREGITPERVLSWARTWSEKHPADRNAGNFDREPEPPTYDEALAAKCDADARMDEARALKGMV